MRAIRLTFLSFASTVVVTALATSAHADTSALSCEDTAYDCSHGGSKLHADSRVPVITSVGTGWVPSCATPDANGHCGSSVPIQVNISVDLAAVPAPSTLPLWSVDMLSSIIDARWPTTNAFQLTLSPSVTQDGTFKVSHSLIPSARVHVDTLGFNLDYAYDASQYLIDYAANFHYLGTNTVTFSPWSFESKVTNLVPAPSLASAELVNQKLVDNGQYSLSLGLAAKTSPTFTYRTTKVTLAGSTPITLAQQVGQLQMTDADFLDLNGDVEGEITVAGDLIAAPNVTFAMKAGPVPINVVLDLSNFGGIAPKVAYTSKPPVVVRFPGVNIHIPLPNVKVPTALDVGTAQIGTNIKAPATIKNTGERTAKLTFKSSDPQFTVIADAQAPQKSDFPLSVVFAPAREGRQSATITVTSNDPDQPTQILAVSGSGSNGPVGPNGSTDSGIDSGCGCHTTPVHSSKLGGSLGSFSPASL